MILRTLARTALLTCFACSGDSDGSLPMSGGTPSETLTFTGTAEVTASGGCRGTGHTFDTGEGELSVTLSQASPSVSLNAQVCHPTAVDHARECTVPPFARIDVGMTLRATLKGGRTQVLTLFPLNCGTPSLTATPPITYSVMVVHHR